jgi:nucleotide-binding universal stress UspA family protein
MAEPRGRPGRLEGRPLSPRAFRPFGVEALLVGAPTVQEGLVRREGVAVWRRLPEHAPVFDRLAATTGTDEDGLLPVRVVVAVTPARDRAMRVPATGERAARVLAAAEGPVPDAGWVLLVDEGPGETWLYLAEEDDPAAVLAGFLGRRGRTDFDRARRRSRLGSLGSVGLLLGLVLAIYGGAMGLGTAGQAIGGTVIAASLLTLVRARPRQGSGGSSSRRR